MIRILIILACVCLAGGVFGKDEPKPDVVPNAVIRSWFSVSHQFDTVQAKDEFLKDVFSTLGKKDGRLTAGVNIVYNWELEEVTITMTDTTGNTGKPGVTVTIRKKPNKAIDNDKK